MTASIFIFVAPQVPLGLGIGLLSKRLYKIGLFIIYVWVKYPYSFYNRTTRDITEGERKNPIQLSNIHQHPTIKRPREQRNKLCQLRPSSRVEGPDWRSFISDEKQKGLAHISPSASPLRQRLSSLQQVHGRPVKRLKDETRVRMDSPCKRENGGKFDETLKRNLNIAMA